MTRLDRVRQSAIEIRERALAMEIGGHGYVQDDAPLPVPFPVKGFRVEVANGDVLIVAHDAKLRLLGMLGSFWAEAHTLQVGDIIQCRGIVRSVERFGFPREVHHGRGWGHITC